MKQSNPENEKVYQPPHAEAGGMVPPAKEVVREDIMLIQAFEKELERGDATLYCEYVNENGRTTGVAVKRYKDVARKPSAGDETVWFENLDALQALRETNEPLATLLRDYEDTKKNHTSH